MWIQVQPNMALKFDGSSITISGTRAVTGPVEIGGIISLSDWVYVPLNLTKILPRLRRMSGLYPSRIRAGKYRRFAALPESTHIRFIKCRPISRVRIRASLWGGANYHRKDSEKVRSPSIGRALLGEKL